MQRLVLGEHSGSNGRVDNYRGNLGVARLLTAIAFAAAFTLGQPQGQAGESSEDCQAAISFLDVMADSGKVPRNVLGEHSKYACSGYAVKLLIEQFGEDAVKAADLWEFADAVDAWELPARGLASGNLREVFNTGEAFSVDETWGKVRLRDKPSYLTQVESYYRSLAEGDSVGDLLTFYYPHSSYAHRVALQNQVKPENERYHNTHVGLLAGIEWRQLPRTNAKEPQSLSQYLQGKLNLPEEVVGLLEFRVENGSDLLEGNLAEIGQAKLGSGARVSYKELIFTDHFVEDTRLFTLTDMLAKRGYFTGSRAIYLAGAYRLQCDSGERFWSSNFMDEQIELLQPSAYWHIDPNSDLVILDQVQEQLGYPELQARQYVQLLDLLDFDFTKLQGRELLPKYSLAEFAKIIDALGGVSGLDLLEQKRKFKYLAENALGTRYLFIDSGMTPWETMGKYFDRMLTEDDQPFSQVEQAKIAQMVNDHLKQQGFDFLADPPVFPAGGIIEFPERLVNEIFVDVLAERARYAQAKDLTALIAPGSRPQDYVQEFVAEVAERYDLGMDYADFSRDEREFLLRTMDSCSPEVDLELVEKEVAGGQIMDWRNFRAGDRLIMREAALLKALRVINLRLSPQELPEEMRDGQTELRYAETKSADSFASFVVPNFLKEEIAELYPNEPVIQKLLYLVLMMESGRGSLRADFKDWLRSWGLVSSHGLFQMRPTRVDVDLSRAKLAEIEINLADDVELGTVRELLNSDTRVSIVFAAERLRSTLKHLQYLRTKNGELTPKLIDDESALLVVNAYNRSWGTVLRTVWQDWARRLADVAGVESLVSQAELDASLHQYDKEDLEENVRETLRRVAEKWNLTETLDVEVIDHLFANPAGFVASDLVKVFQAIYAAHTGEYLQLRVERAEIEENANIFTYGRKAIPAAEDWADLFTDYQMYQDVESMLAAGAINVEPYSDESAENYAQNHSTVREVEAKLRKGEYLIAEKSLLDERERVLGELKELSDSGENKLKVYASAVAFYEDLGEGVTGNLLIGTELVVEDLLNYQDDHWLKVKIGSGPYAGRVGYVPYKLAFYHPGTAPVLTTALRAKLLGRPGDYQESLRGYLKYLSNRRSAGDVEQSIKRMEKGRATAQTVENSEEKAVAVEFIKRKLAADFTKDRFAGIVCRGNYPGLKANYFYLLDRATNELTKYAITPGANYKLPRGVYRTESYGNEQADVRAAAEFGRALGNDYWDEEVYPGGFQERGTSILMTTARIGTIKKGQSDGQGRFFHGTNREQFLGKVGHNSSGCIRMANLDIVHLLWQLNGAQITYYVH